jgi:hypothetical protein
MATRMERTAANEEGQATNDKRLVIIDQHPMTNNK